MAQFASDDFAGTAGTELSAYNSAWTEHSSYSTGNFLLSDANRLRTDTSQPSCYYHSGAPASADYSVTLGLFSKTANPSHSKSAAGRINTGADTMYYAAYLGGGTNTWRLYKRVAGVQTTLGSSASTYADETARDVQLKMVGSTIELYADGGASPLVTVTDTAITAAGKAGIRGTTTADSDTAGLHVDSFSADDVGAGTTYNVDVSESASASDSVSSSQALAAALSEAASASDSTSATLTLAAELAEALSATDAFAATVVLAAMLSEGAAAADTVTGTLVMDAALSEPATATDLVNWGGAVYAVAVDEAASAADAVSAAAILAAALSEIAAAADSFVAGLLAVGAVSEPAAAADSVTGLMLLQAAIAEAVAAADSMSSGNGVVYAVTIAEAGAASDNWTSTLSPAVRAAITAYRRTWMSPHGVRPAQTSTSRRRN